MTVQVRVKKLHPDAKIPRAAKVGDVAFDLYSIIDYELRPGERFAVPTGIAVEIPVGYEGQVRPRSGLALKEGLSVLNTPGTIDSDYRGLVNLILINLGKEDYIIKRGSRLAQMVIREVTRAEFVETESLGSTARAQGGFGHTGI